MLRIGEAARQFAISNRTLRYWEESGILKSTRTESGYRYYDDENVSRINQIVLLRKLKMPIADIERIFIAADFRVAVDALTGHLENLKQQTVLYSALTAVIENLIWHIKDNQSLDQVFSYLDKYHISIDSKHEETPQIQLSERTVFMSEERLNNVRIIKLPPMTVAACRAESASPENDCGKVFNKFVLDNNLHKRDGYRQFGFNNPSPSEGNPVYGYEMWVTIPEDFNVPDPLVKKQFGGGLYASISTHMNEIGERWQMLYNWCENSDKYDADFSFQWLEECSMDFETFISEQVPDSEKQLDLLEPVKLKSHVL